MLLLTLRQPLCKNNILKYSAELMLHHFKRLLAITSTQPSFWAARDDMLLGNLLSAICHRLCIYADMASALRLSSAARYWDGNQSFHDSSFCCRKLPCVH